VAGTTQGRRREVTILAERLLGRGLLRGALLLWRTLLRGALGEALLVGVLALLPETLLPVRRHRFGLLDVTVTNGAAGRDLHFGLDRAIGDIGLAVRQRRDEHFVRLIGHGVLGPSAQDRNGQRRAGGQGNRQLAEIYHRGVRRDRLGVEILQWAGLPDEDATTVRDDGVPYLEIGLHGVGHRHDEVMIGYFVAMGVHNHLAIDHLDTRACGSALQGRGRICGV